MHINVTTKTKDKVAESDRMIAAMKQAISSRPQQEWLGQKLLDLKKKQQDKQEFAQAIFDALLEMGVQFTTTKKD